MKDPARRDFLRAMGLGAASLALPSCAGLLAAEKRPNVVFIITDDQRLDTFGFLRHKAHTPNIDRLASEGVYFTRAYVSSSVCTPTRYSCLTGQYASRSRGQNFRRSTTSEGQTNVQWNTDIVPGDLTLPEVLRRAGYVTGAVGKWHNGGPRSWKALRSKLPRDADPSDPDVARALKSVQKELHAHVRSCGFDYAEAINFANYGAHPVRKLRYHNQEWITKAALDFIEANRKKPFYLYMATTLMHGPLPIRSLDVDPRITHGGLLDAPPDVQPPRGSVVKRARAAGVRGPLVAATWLDDGVGAVMKKLDALGLKENTLVVYFNDHGVEAGKGTCYEGGVRTPCFVRFPGRAKPRKCHALVQNIDFAPTIMSACGARPPAEMHIDGVDLMPLLEGRSKSVRESLYFEIGHTRAVIEGDWKYLAFRIPPSRQLSSAERRKLAERYKAGKKSREDKDMKVDPDAPLSHMGFPGGQGTELGPIRKHRGTYFDRDQLYDLAKDPDERRNLAGDPACRERLEKMKRLLAEHLTHVPGTFAEFKTM